jgi:dihydroxy-acid dehydratase
MTEDRRSNVVKQYPSWHHLVQRGLFMAMGFSETSYERPWIAIANTWSEANPGHYHLRQLSEAVKRGIWQEGGTPVEFNTISICDGMALDKRYHLPARELIAFSTSHFLEAHAFAGCVFISSCDKNVPAQLMAAARVNLPSIFVTGGSMLPGRFRDEDIVCCTDGRRLFGEFEKGEMSEPEFLELLDCTHSGVGACGTMGTANTMQSLTEALGVCWPGSAVLPAVSARKYWQAERSGRQIMALVQKGLTARKIMTLAAFENAGRVLMAMGGSTNAILHLTAIAREAGLRLDLDFFSRMSAETPFLCDVKPSGQYTVRDFAAAGGVVALQRELGAQLNLEVITVTGKTLAENLAEGPGKRGDVIADLKRPLSPDGGIVVLRGNLAPEGAILKRSGVRKDLLHHRGRARVFDSYHDFETLIHHGTIDFGPDQVLIIRNEGPRGGPGMQEILIPPAFYRHGLEDMVVITDGRTSGTSRGRLIVHVSPEAAIGGPLGVIRDGDWINLDIERGHLGVDLEDREIKTRLAQRSGPSPSPKKDWLGLYQHLAASAVEGAGMLW